MVMKIKRCESGIDGFDNLIAGGFVKGSANVVLGNAGAGKSIFLMQFLKNGAQKFNENGIYLTFELDPEEVIIDALAFGWDLSEILETNKLRVVKLSPKSSLEKIKSTLKEIIKKHDIQRICIDPVNLWTINSNARSDTRIQLYELVSFLKKLKITTILSEESSGLGSERGDGEDKREANMLRFLVDGVIELYSSGFGGGSDRALRVTKMRRTNHFRGPVPFAICDKGISISKEK
jgi:circadian clock protein KaiC